MSPLRVMTIVGTRPEIIRLSRCIPKFDEFFDHTLVHTGQNYDYELNEIFFEDLELRRPDIYLNVAGGTPAETIGRAIIESDKVLAQYKPEAVVILGDTNSSMAAISAKRRKIPIFHLEAGNRCFDQRVPEEINRKIVDHIADVNITYSQIAREYLLAEGFASDRIIKLGSPLYEVLQHYRHKINRSTILNKLELKRGEYLLFSFHREENVDDEDNLSLILDTINEIERRYNLPIIVSTHPRTKKRLAGRDSQASPLVQFCSPFAFTDYVFLQEHAKCVISDSGSITEESSILNLRSINLRDTHERPEGNEKMPTILSGVRARKVIAGIELLSKFNTNQSLIVMDYKVEDFSNKLIKVLFSYTEFVRSYVWRQ